SEQAEVSRNRLVCEQVNQVQRTLIYCVRAIFDVVGNIEQLAHRRTMSAGDARLDPVVEAEMIQCEPVVIEVVIERRIARGIEILLDRLVDGVEVVVRLLSRIILIEEKVRLRRLRRLGSGQVDGLNPKALRQSEDCFVSRVDQFAAMLRDLPAL